MRTKQFANRKEYMREYMRSRRENPVLQKEYNLSYREIERARDAERKRLSRMDIKKLEEHRAKDAARKRLARSGQLTPKIKKDDPEKMNTKTEPKVLNSKKIKSEKPMATASSSKKVADSPITKPEKEVNSSPLKKRPIKLKIRLPIKTKNKTKKKQS